MHAVYDCVEANLFAHMHNVNMLDSEISGIMYWITITASCDSEKLAHASMHICIYHTCSNYVSRIVSIRSEIVT